MTRPMLTRLVLIICLAPGAMVRAHEVTIEDVVEMVVEPRGKQLVVHLDLPAAVLTDAKLPGLADGSFDTVGIAELLRVVAPDLARNLDVRQGDALLAAPRTRAQVGSDRRSIQVDFTYDMNPAEVGISARLNAFRSAARPVRTQVQFRPSLGPSRTLTVVGTPTRVVFDPTARETVQQFMARALRAVLDGGDHLLFIVCLLLPLQRARTAAGLLAGVASGQLITMATLAFAPPVSAQWLGVVTMVAASVVVVAALQNIVRVRVSWIGSLAVAFGVLNGFAFEGIVAPTLQFAGAHRAAALTVFVLVVAAGQLWLGAVLWATRAWLDGLRVPEQIVTVLGSVTIAHSAIHRVIDRGHTIAQARSFFAEHAVVGLTLTWASVMLLIILAAALRDRYHNHQPRAAHIAHQE